MHMAHARVWVIQIRRISMGYLHHKCVYTKLPNNMHPMYNVPQLAAIVSHSQPPLTKYFANGGSIAVISMSQVDECMAMIWHVVTT